MTNGLKTGIHRAMDNAKKEYVLGECKEWKDRSFLGKAFAYALAIPLLALTLICPQPIWPGDRDKDWPHH